MCCLGKITSPDDGTNITIIPGESDNIIWLFDDMISNVGSRTWFFTSSDGVRKGPLGGILSDSTPAPQNGVLSGIGITKPATLTLNNVNQSYDGTYRFTLTATETDMSNVRVFIASKFHY